MALVQDGDVQAFEEAYDRHSSHALGLAYRILRDRTAAEDAVQEAFVSVWKGATSFDHERGSLRSWILSIVRHRSVDAVRRNQRHRSQSSGGENDDLLAGVEGGESPSAQIEQQDDARSLRLAIETLPPDQRAAIDMAYFGGLTHTEIAARLGLPLGTVKGRMRLGLTKLRPLCEPAGG